MDREKLPQVVRQKSKYVVPNAITAASLLMGLASIYFSSLGHLETAAWVILYSTLLDKLDGTTARALNASSSFGVEFDSFSDFTAFGLAPSFLVFTFFSTDVQMKAMTQGSEAPFFLLFAVVLFILASATRLARFNVTTVPGSHFILGMATTIAGGLTAAFFLACMAHRDLPIVAEALTYMPYLLIFFAAMMLSTFPSVKPGGRGSRGRNLQDACVFLALALLILLRQLPEVIFAAGVVAILIGFAIGFKHRDEALGRTKVAEAAEGDDEA